MSGDVSQVGLNVRGPFAKARHLDHHFGGLAGYPLGLASQIPGAVALALNFSVESTAQLLLND